MTIALSALAIIFTSLFVSWKTGVYMIGRLNYIFLLIPNVMILIAWIGALTALFAATIAIAQNDIKKILAYSTISQLGYMFMAMGVGAFSSGIFHLATHAFFKGLLFLAAGSVIYAMHHEQNIFKMGNLRGKLPITFAVFSAGWYAICALPLGSGFFSKDMILHHTYSSQNGGILLLLMGLITGGLTAFYMSRLYFVTFFGESRLDKKVDPRNIKEKGTNETK
jgi:NADH-quinone oxidoreductase subunit L